MAPVSQKEEYRRHQMNALRNWQVNLKIWEDALGKRPESRPMQHAVANARQQVRILEKRLERSEE